MVHVVGAVFYRESDKNESEILLFRRKDGEKLFEFPGGKVESGESEKAALEREIWEELGVRIKIQAKVGENIFYNGKKDIRLVVYLVGATSWTFDLKEHTEARWIRKNAVPENDIMTGDLPLIKAAFQLIAAARAGEPDRKKNR